MSKKLETTIQKMKEGDSFFCEGKKPSDLVMLRRIGYRLGITLQISAIASDEIYVGKSGSRVWHRGKKK